MSDPKPADPTPTPTPTPTPEPTPTPTPTPTPDPTPTPVDPKPADPKPADPDPLSLISEGGKPKDPEPTPTPDVTPITAADLKFPEGFEIDESAQKEFVDIMNEGLTRSELANKLVTFQSTMAQAASDSISSAWDDMVEEWQTAAEAHPEVGGDKLAPALGSIKTLINEVMKDKANEVFDAFDLTGVGNNPAVISLLSKLASERAEGKPTTGDPTTAPTTLAKQMFPNQGQK